MIFENWQTPEQWAQAAVNAGYSAVYFPCDYTAPQSVIDGFVSAAKDRDLVICEIGVWNNLLDPDRSKREAAYERSLHQLELADYVRANCCVNIAGTYNENVWDGPHRDSLSRRAFDEIVVLSQKLLDAVRPQNTFYTLEPMPFLYPDTADSALALIKAVDRPAFGAHIDIVNVISSPQLYYGNTAVINEWFDKLASYIRSCHAKDIILRDELTVHLDECRPGTGILDYDTYLKRVSGLEDPRICLMLEHMTEAEDYRLATEFIKSRAQALGIRL